MHPTQLHDTQHRHETEPTTTVPGLQTQAALVAAPPLTLWALTNPAQAMLALAVLAALAWHRLVATRSARAGPTQPPD
jgi:hypothetical protein